MRKERVIVATAEDGCRDDAAAAAVVSTTIPLRTRIIGTIGHAIAVNYSTCIDLHMHTSSTFVLCGHAELPRTNAYVKGSHRRRD